MLVCDQGTYGKDCNSTCGYCVEQKDCHHINGTCLKGCKPGYFGELCKERKFIDIYNVYLLFTHGTLTSKFNFKRCFLFILRNNSNCYVLHVQYFKNKKNHRHLKMP